MPSCSCCNGSKQVDVTWLTYWDEGEARSRTLCPGPIDAPYQLPCPRCSGTGEAKETKGEDK